jgi:uncharacterized membrane protein YgcG
VAPTQRIKSTNISVDQMAKNAVQQLEGLNTMEAASHVAVAITKMKKGILAKMQMSGSSDLRLTQHLLHKLNEFILPTLEDTVRVSVSSAQRQLDTQPRRRVDMEADEIDNEDDPAENPYAAVLMPRISHLTTRPTALCSATAIIVGVDGPAAKLATMLARRGIGRLILFDDSVVAENDWRNSTVFSPDMVGFPRVQAVCGAILRINADTELEAACVDVREPVGQTLLAYCLRHGSIVIPSDFDGAGAGDGSGGSSSSSRASSRGAGGGGGGSRDISSAEGEGRTKRRVGNRRSGSDRQLQPLNVFTARAESERHGDPPRRLKKTTSYVNRLCIRNDFGVQPGAANDDPPTSNEAEVATGAVTAASRLREAKSIVISCHNNEHAVRVVGDAAMEFSIAALFGKSVPRKAWEGGKDIVEAAGAAGSGGQELTLSDVAHSMSAKYKTGQMMFVVPGLTTCLHCRSSIASDGDTGLSKGAGKAKSTSGGGGSATGASEAAPAGDERHSEGAHRSHLCTGTMFSAAAHAVVASMLCQTVLTHFLANPNGKSRLGSAVWYGNSDALLSKEVTAPNHNCTSARCRRQQKARRKNMHKMKMRKVLKVSNMFSWTKKKNTASPFGGGAAQVAQVTSETVVVPQPEEAGATAALTMTELAAKASARRSARRRG